MCTFKCKCWINCLTQTSPVVFLHINFKAHLWAVIINSGSSHVFPYKKDLYLFLAVFTWNRLFLSKIDFIFITDVSEFWKHFLTWRKIWLRGPYSHTCSEKAPRSFCGSSDVPWNYVFLLSKPCYWDWVILFRRVKVLISRRANFAWSHLLFLIFLFARI